jgi:predicted permease
VASASLARDWPFQVSVRRTVLLEGDENASNGAERRALMESVGPGHLQTAGIALISGRDFGALDGRASPRVAIVNQAAAAHFWPGRSPVGRRLRFFGEDAPVEVIGVARNASYLEISEQPQAMVYVSALQYYSPATTVWVRTAGDPETVLPALRREIQALDRNLLLQAQSTREILREALWAQRLSAGLLAAFGGLALLLAAVGIYGLISHSVNQRVREIGVRMALGASPTDVGRMVMREGCLLTGAGLAAGMGIAVVCERVLGSRLFLVGGVRGTAFAAAPTVLIAAALFASWIPARRATRVDPATALRDE